ncbi:hypothetical protein CROQUDRAFT_48720, partial [Cronartium quercuum f. sp. fusiforme G11]
AFIYMRINKKFTTNISLLERTYNHYVHYYMAGKYKREMKEEGKNQRDDERKKIQRARKWLRDAHYKHALRHEFPRRYLKMLHEIDAHSDDEYNPKRDMYIVKTLPFRSAKAGQFMQRVDDHMIKSKQLARRPDQKRTRLRPLCP